MTSVPRATYRLQLRNGMDFARAASLAPYLARLGISHLYLSPPFAAVPGSTHGYDVVDPNRFEPELGGEAGFMALRRALDAHGLALILDIVPNHMGIGRANAWWWDVLRHGRGSRYANFFDIDFEADPDGKLVLPVLGAPLDETIERGELRLMHEAGDSLLIYGDERFPLALERAPATDLPALLTAQHYRLVFWREGVARRNYRRFFNIDQLAGLRIEDSEVFEESHRLILDLAGRGLIQGLRVDHVDGLTDPKAYLDRLQRRLAEVTEDQAPFYLVVEKILCGEESLPADWPVAGTTGYEFMNEALGVLVSAPGLEALARTAAAFIDAAQDYPATVRTAKAEVLDRLFAGEFATLVKRAVAAGLDEATAEEGLRRLVISFPVYRTYGGNRDWGSADRAVLRQAFAQAAEGADGPTAAGLARLQRTLVEREPRAAKLLQGLQQLSGPLMAKSVEDTAFYRHHRLLALNEVGGEPHSPGVTPEAFHRSAASRLARWPDTMLATATHDTKRGEDARARLAVLSEVPEAWEAAVAAWRTMNAGLPTIHPADEYALYQSLVGAWPIHQRPEDEAGLENLRSRLEGWLAKALREGKERSDWNEPDSEYEQRATAFLRMSTVAGGPFVKAVAAFITRIQAPAMANSLGQLLLKLTSPGVPDIYQGTETSDLSLVDPDNRRPVDFATRQRALAEAPGSPTEAKLTIIRAALRLRSREPVLFARGGYRPLEVQGELAPHVLAYARVNGERVALAVITRLLGRRLLGAASAQLPAASWADTALVLPQGWLHRSWRDCLGDAEVRMADDNLPLASLLSRQPVALLVTEPAKRSSL